VVNDLEQALRALGRELAYPATPEIVPSVRARLRHQPQRRRLGARRAVLAAFAGVLLAATGAVAAVPATRHAVLDWLGLRSIRIERVPTQPSAPRPGALGVGLDLGRRTTTSGARASVRFPILTPRLLGLGDAEVYVSSSPPGGRITLLYRARPGLPRAVGSGVGMLITEFRGDQPVDFIEKTLGPGTTAEQLTLQGEPAVWISGQPHVVVFRDADGTIREDTLRLAGNTLLWRRGALLLRIEAHISKAAALRIARSMR
jgi:hypothetical protein